MTELQAVQMGGGPEDRAEIQQWSEYARHLRTMAVGAVIGAGIGKIIGWNTAETGAIGMIVGLAVHDRTSHQNGDFASRLCQIDSL